METIYFSDVKNYIGDKTYDIKRFIYRTDKKMQQKINSLVCDIDYLHSSIKKELLKTAIYIIVINLLTNILLFCLIQK